ncbi:MAG: GTPase HflX [Defluviitaleaceae bacterium]|nr:GTPase HflX [Defluviitaleaceae bacterium]
MYDTKNTQDDVILVGLEEDLTELMELAITGHCNIVGELVQAREHPHPRTYLGKGKVEELQALIQATGANGIITDDELTPSQLKHLTELLDAKVMDRTILILDIFARNATSAEAIAQVEIAQQQYNLAHLTGMGINMSRLGGGIGTRGPGEKKLETDRRAIRSRISELKKELKTIENHRNNQRKARIKNEIYTLSLVGYTNAGKSSVMNALTSGAWGTPKNSLFSTLDTTTRKLSKFSGKFFRSVVLTDTVGFIQKLPTNLIDAFKSTLEEMRYSTVLLHVVDISNPNYRNQMDLVYDTLGQLGYNNIPVITVFNKIDKTDEIYPIDQRAVATVAISAKLNKNIELLEEAIMEVLERRVN